MKKMVLVLLVFISHSLLANDNGLIEKLNHSSLNGDLKNVKILVKKGADVNGFSSNGWRPIISASFNGHLEIVKYLVKNGANVNLQSKVGYTALHKASYKGHTEVVKYLLSKGARVDILDNEGKTPLLITVDFYLANILKNTDTISILLKKGSNPETRDKEGVNVFDLVYRFRNHKLAKLLNNYGYKVDLVIDSLNIAKKVLDANNIDYKDLKFIQDNVVTVSFGEITSIVVSGIFGKNAPFIPNEPFTAVIQYKKDRDLKKNGLAIEGRGYQFRNGVIIYNNGQVSIYDNWTKLHF